MNNLSKKTKVLDEKRKREQMMHNRQEIIKHKQSEELKNDKEYIDNVNKAIRDEHTQIINDRIRDQQKYQEMLEDNQKRLVLLKKEHKLERIKDQDVIKEMMASEERLQRQREAEFNARLQRIQAKMSKMADTVVKNEKDKMLQEERRLLALQTEKERSDLKEENDRKNRILTQNQMIQN